MCSGFLHSRMLQLSLGRGFLVPMHCHKCASREVVQNTELPGLFIRGKWEEQQPGFKTKHSHGKADEEVLVSNQTIRRDEMKYLLIMFCTSLLLNTIKYIWSRQSNSEAPERFPHQPELLMNETSTCINFATHITHRKTGSHFGNAMHSGMGGIDVCPGTSLCGLHGKMRCPRLAPWTSPLTTIILRRDVA